MHFQSLVLITAMALSLPAAAKPTLLQRGVARLTFREMLKRDPAAKGLFRAEQNKQRVFLHRGDVLIHAVHTTLGAAGTAMLTMVTPVGAGVTGVGTGIAAERLRLGLKNLSAANRQARVETVKQIAAKGKLSPGQSEIFKQAGWVQ